MDTTTFRACLDRLGLSQGALARLLTELGDPASALTVLRRVERWAQGAARVPGEMVAFLALLERYPRILRDLRGAVVRERPARE